MHLSTKTLVCLSLIGGALIGLTPDVEAQVTITGGDFSGNAGFFMPGMGTNIRLFDARIQTLNLESSIGNTSTVLFSTDFVGFNNDGPDTAIVDAGDTGVLLGRLTGLAYDSNAFPVLFTNVGTKLDFSVTDFTIQRSLNGGTLISPRGNRIARLVFFDRPVTLVAQSAFVSEAIPGDLDVGPLTASLTGGAINLPATFSFLNSGRGSGFSSDFSDSFSCNSTCGSGTTATPTSAININVRTINDLLADVGDKPDSTVANPQDQNNLTKEEYDALDEQLEAVNIDIKIDIDIKVAAWGHERYYVAYPKEYKGKYKGKGKYRGQKYSRNNVVCFRQVGPGSTIFPGLISLVQIDFDNIPVEIIADLPEIDDADVDDDTDVDSDSDSGDDSDSSNDSDTDVDSDSDSGDDSDSSNDSDDDNDSDGNSGDDSDSISDDDSDRTTEEIVIVPGLTEMPAESGEAAE